MERGNVGEINIRSIVVNNISDALCHDAMLFIARPGATTTVTATPIYRGI